MRGAWADETPFARTQIDATHRAVLALKIDLIGILRVDEADEAVTPTNAKPVAVDRPSVVVDSRRTAPTPIVLKSTVDSIVPTRAYTDVIELRNDKLIVMIPVCHAIVGLIESSVIAKQNVTSIRRVDPQGMMVDMHLASGSV